MDYRIKINLYPIFLYAVFYSYIISYQYGFLAGLLVIYSAIIYRSKLDRLEISVSLIKTLIAICISVVFTIINVNLNDEINGDMILHTHASYHNILYLFKYLPQTLDHFSSKYIMIAYSYLIFISLFIFYFLNKFRWKYFYSLFLLISVLILLTKAYNGHFIDSVSSQPSLRELPVVLLGIFGMDDILLRFQSSIPVTILVLYIVSIKTISTIKKIGLISIFLSLPLIYYNSAILEFSIWGYVAVSIFLFEYFLKDGEFSSNNYTKLFFLLSLMACIRMTVILPLLLLLFHAAYHGKFKGEFLAISSPALMILFISLLQGTPSSYDPNIIFLDVPVNMSIFDRMVFSLSAERLWIVYQQIGIATIVGMAGAIYVIIIRIRKLYAILIFLITAWVMFHAIKPHMWYIPRYLIEYIIPFSALGYLYLSKTIKTTLFALLSFGIVSLNIINIISNVNPWHNIYDNVYEAYYNGDVLYISERQINISDAILDNLDKCKKYRIHGSSIIPMILHGSNVKKVKDMIKYSDNSDCNLKIIYGNHGDYYNSKGNSSVTLEINK